MSVNIREATKDDLGRVTDIYGNSVLTGTASFETKAPNLAEMQQRFTELTEMAYPYLVAVLDGQIAGYAYAGPYRARPAYY